MYKLVIAWMLLAGLASLTLNGRPRAIPNPEVSIESMKWLAGCWKGTDTQTEILEQWMQPSAGLMLGIGRTVKNGQVKEYEFMRIGEENGSLVYTAIPSGQPQASFTLIKATDGEFVFENKEHDFPQRIIYKSQTGGLLARIEGAMNGKLRGIDFPMTRAACPGGPGN